MRKVLIANRGEIAVRIARACRERGLGVVAVYAGPDAHRAHVLMADEAVCLDAPTDPRPAAAYLSVDRVIDAARRTGADAIHPGYGFLSERPALAAACADAGLTFVGPPAAVIERMGSKLEARRLMEAAGVPCVPGARPDDQSHEALRAAAMRVGFPLLVKASAGGGGKGMRVVERADDLDEAIGAARREAEAAFGDGTLYLEQRIAHPRHIEVQVVADAFDTTLHFGERECSLQRRHQKVIEEASSPVVSPALRARLGAAAVAAARAAGYRNAGTVEFLVDGEGDEARFHFLEMNTRLQVEHPVTELVMGVDLVHLQFDVAAGLPLLLEGPGSESRPYPRGPGSESRPYPRGPGSESWPYPRGPGSESWPYRREPGSESPPDRRGPHSLAARAVEGESGPYRRGEAIVEPRGHAVECRVYAEAPAQGFLPQAGTVIRYLEPQGPGVRVDSGVREGDTITPDFDPLLAKVVVHAPTRPQALARARQALRDLVVLGLRTNAPYLLRVLSHPDIEAGHMHTGWLALHHDALTAPHDAANLAMAAAVAARHRQLPADQQRRGATLPSGGPDRIGTPWETLGGWRG